MALWTITTKERPAPAPEIPKIPIGPEKRSSISVRRRIGALAIAVATGAGIFGVATLMNNGETTATSMIAPTTTEVPTTTEAPTTTARPTTTNPNVQPGTPEANYALAIENIYKGEYPALTKDYIESQLGGDYVMAFGIWLEGFEQFMNEDSASISHMRPEEERLAGYERFVYPEFMNTVSDDWLGRSNAIATWRDDTLQVYERSDPTAFRIEFYPSDDFKIVEVTPTGVIFTGAILNSGGSLQGWLMDGPVKFREGTTEMRFSGEDEILKLFD